MLFKCYCGNEPETGFEWAWPDKCNEKCGGDSDQICGGSMAMSVYSVAKDGICIYDFPASRRVLDRFSVTGHVNMTIDLCRGICDSKSSRLVFKSSGLTFPVFSDITDYRMVMNVIVVITIPISCQQINISVTCLVVVTATRLVAGHGG